MTTLERQRQLVRRRASLDAEVLRCSDMYEYYKTTGALDTSEAFKSRAMKAQRIANRVHDQIDFDFLSTVYDNGADQ